MSNWSPVPRNRPLLNEGIFKFDQEYSVEKSIQTPIERQRALDGTPVTRGGASALGPQVPNARLSLGDFDKANQFRAETIEKSRNAKPKVDPDAVVKAFMEMK
jgi:hypothetical protein